MIQATLVILPGWGGNKETWADFLPLSELNFATVNLIELPCFGDEPCPDQVWGLREYAEFVRAKIANLPRPLFILGHSFGGAVATQLLQQSPGLADKLVLVGPASIRPKNIARRFFFGAIAKLGKWIFRLPILEKFEPFLKKLLYRAAKSPDYTATATIKRDIFKKIIREDQTKILPNLKTPTLLIWGKKDTYTPLPLGKKMATLIPNARLEILPNCGHGVHLQAPKELLSLIINFVKEEHD